MNKKRVVVEGGGNNLYQISEYNGDFVAYYVDVGFITNSYKNIGETRSFENAIVLIKVHSGKEIKKISDY